MRRPGQPAALCADRRAAPRLQTRARVAGGLQAKALLADKTYDSDKIVQAAQVQGMEVIIPSKANRKQPRPLDKHRYKARHLIENLFQRMKVFSKRPGNTP